MNTKDLDALKVKCIRAHSFGVALAHAEMHAKELSDECGVTEVRGVKPNSPAHLLRLIKLVEQVRAGGAKPVAVIVPVAAQVPEPTSHVKPEVAAEVEIVKTVLDEPKAEEPVADVEKLAVEEPAVEGADHEDGDDHEDESDVAETDAADEKAPVKAAPVAKGKKTKKKKGKLAQKGGGSPRPSGCPALPVSEQRLAGHSAHDAIGFQPVEALVFEPILPSAPLGPMS